MSTQTATCRRCGIERTVKPERGVPELCSDCRLVESDLAAIDDWHGTHAGYSRHMRRREIACEACLKGHREVVARWRHSTGKHRPMTPPACGTHSGYCAHHKRKEPPCDLCRAAESEYQRARYLRNKAGVAA